MGKQMAFVLYRPHEGQDEALRALMAEHVPTLRRLGMVTDGSVYRGKTKDGSYFEVFEWVSAEAVSAAHGHPEVEKIWNGMAAIADFPALANLEEAGGPFPDFPIVDL